MRDDRITGPIRDFVEQRLAAIADAVDRHEYEAAAKKWPDSLLGKPVVWIKGTYQEKRPFCVLSCKE